MKLFLFVFSSGKKGGELGAMGDAVGHASTAFCVLIAAFVEVADNALLGFAALGFRIQIRNVAE